MNRYQVFGGVLCSELEFPELDCTTRSECDWTLTATTTPAPELPLGAPLGEDKVDQGVMVRSYATPDGFRLVYDDTGVFDVTDRGGAKLDRAREAAVRQAIRAGVDGLRTRRGAAVGQLRACAD